MVDLSRVNPEDIWADDLPDNPEDIWGGVVPSPMDVDPDVAQELLRRMGRDRAFAQGRGAQGWLRGLSQAMTGPTLGAFADLVGAAAPMAGLPQDQAADYIKGAIAQERENNPITSAITAGMASSPLFLGAPGAVRGIGASVGAARNALAQRLGMAASQAAPKALPGYVGSTAAGVGAGATAGGIQAGAEARSGERSGAAVEGTMLGGMLSAIPVVGGPLATAVGRLSTKGGAKDAALREIAKNLQRDMPQAPAIGRERTVNEKLKFLGKEGRLIDTAGENTVRLADVLAISPGETANIAKNVIRGRHQARYDALVNSIDKQLGTKGREYIQHVDGLTTARIANAKPFYDVIDSTTITVDPRLADALAITRDSHGTAEKMARLGLRMDIDLSGLKAGDQVPLPVLENVYRSLRDAGRKASIAGEGNLAHDFTSGAQYFANVLDDYAPKVEGKSVLREARKAFAEPSSAIDLAETGRKAMTGDLLNLRLFMRDMQPGEKESFRIGLAQGIKELAGTEAGQTRLLNAWKNPTTRDRLKVALGDAYPEFYNTIRAQEKMKQIQSLGRGSQTQPRQAMSDDLGMAAQMAADAKTGGGAGLLAKGAKMIDAMPLRMSERARNEAGGILFSRGGEARKNNMLINAMLRSMEQRETIKRATGAGTGAAAARNKEERR